MARYEVSRIWERKPEGIASRVREALDLGLEQAPANRARVFFRADDVAVPGAMCEAMFQVFRERDAVLCPAVVPSWLTGPRWEVLKRQAGEGWQRWSWHQHGWKHVNHEPQGRKYEFGPSRTSEALKKDLALGKHRLESLLGQSFVPIFTPPWNRVSFQAMQNMLELGFSGISRDLTAKPVPPAGLPDFQVNVDLHTRRGETWQKGWDALAVAMEQAASTGSIGFMLHHQRMNHHAVAFLGLLISILQDHPRLELGGFPVS